MSHAIFDKQGNIEIYYGAFAIFKTKKQAIEARKNGYAIGWYEHGSKIKKVMIEKVD